MQQPLLTGGENVLSTGRTVPVTPPSCSPSHPEKRSPFLCDLRREPSSEIPALSLHTAPYSIPGHLIQWWSRPPSTPQPSCRLGSGHSVGKGRSPRIPPCGPRSSLRSGPGVAPGGRVQSRFQKTPAVTNRPLTSSSPKPVHSPSPAALQVLRVLLAGPPPRS